MMLNEDCEAWFAYPNHRRWFNKLDLSDRLGYYCGPCGTAPSKSNEYIVRPIYNLSGMGIGAKIQYIKADDYSKVPPGYFWCELFKGKHYSVNYENCKAVSCWEGENDKNNLYRFSQWIRSDHRPELPQICRDELKDIDRINIEFIGSNIIEVHLRGISDPDYDVLIPIWADQDDNYIDSFTKEGYNYVQAYDDAEGFLKIPRLGFLTKNH